MSAVGLSAGIFYVALAILLWIAWGLGRTRWVRDLPDTLPATPPKVSIVFAALNEEATIEPALRSLLALDYPAYELVAIDDRSTDATGAILDRIAAEDPRVRVIHIDKLPAGWLGKNHALHAGAAAATGELLLFTDADIMFERRALRQTVAWFQANELDHLTVFPDMHSRTRMAGAMICGTFLFLLLNHPLWMLRKWRRAFCGVGAFNMVRASAYRAWGGHEPLKLEVLDDMMLGRLVKQQGLRQDALLGTYSVAVEWYEDAPAMVKGLEKNGFTTMDYNVARVAASSLMLLAVRYWPYLGLFVTSGRARWFCAGAIFIDFIAHVLVVRITSLPASVLVWWPLNSGLMVFAMLRSTILTLRRGGVVWRGTVYPLDDLRRAHKEMLARPFVAAPLALPPDRPSIN